jgi:hypothetical protein
MGRRKDEPKIIGCRFTIAAQDQGLAAMISMSLFARQIARSINK